MHKNCRSLRRLIVTAFVPVALLLLAFATQSCSLPGSREKVESITLGTVLLEPSTLIFVAEDQGLFAKHGLDLSIKYYDTGLSAADAMLKGEVDLSGPVTEYVLAGKAFGGERLKAIGSIDKVDYASIIARRDRGINAASNLLGKRIGVARGTMLEFRLGRFLELQGIQAKDFVLVDTTLAKSADAIAAGDIDAVIAVPPYVEAAKGRLGDNALVWPAQVGQLSYQLLLAKSEWIGQHPSLVERFLRTMSEAEEYVMRRPGETNALLQKKLNLANPDVERIRSQNTFSLSLDQSLIVAMEDEARWMILSGLAKTQTVPDFLEYIHMDGLKKVKPQAVNIIH